PTNAAKIVQTSAMRACSLMAECSLSYTKIAHSFGILIKTLFQCVAIAFQYVAILFALLSQQAIALRHFCCHLAIIGFLFYFLVANGVCFNYFL
ncbi:MAG: hypothetical protein Q3Y05_05920, partial [Hallella sp.]|nr:hypothetical protein [Hallella sp.]